MKKEDYEEQENELDEDQEKKQYAQKIIARHDQLKSARSNWESHWQECMEYIIPRKDDVLVTRNPGEKRGNLLYDSTAIMSNLQLAGALHGVLTNPSTRFFDLVMGDPMLDDEDEVKKWLGEVADSMYHIFNNSNFQTEIHEIYLDQGAIGTSCLYVGESEESVLHFNAYPIREIYIDENNLGLIDTVNREFKWRPKQIVQEFGIENVPEFIEKRYKQNADDQYTIIHTVHPVCVDDCDCCEKIKIKGHKYKSCYVLRDEALVIYESGFHEFPYAVPRWTKTSGEVYGRGPGMDMLPDIKMVNVMMQTTLEGAQKTVNPPMSVPDDGVIGKVRLTPGGLTIMRPGSEPLRPIITDARIDFGYQAVEDVRKRIKAGFYADLFTLREGPQMTATEVNTIAEQQMRLMGPILGRQHFEFLRPVIERSFGIMARKDMIPPAPKQINGKKFDVRYSSLVAKAQRMNEGTNITRAISTAAPIFQLDNKIVDNLNTDAMLKYIMDIYGISPKLLHTKFAVEEQRKARVMAQQKLMEEEQAKAGADMAAKVMPGVAQMEMAGANSE